MTCSIRLLLLVVTFASSLAVAQQTERPAVGEPVTGIPSMTPKGWTDRYWRHPDGTWFHYVEMGQGVPVILLHGMGSSHVSWFGGEVFQRLAQTNRAIALDMRYARRPPELAAPRPGSNAEDIVEFMKAAGIEKAHIGGYSMGAATVMALMQSSPERFITAHIGGAGPGETMEFRNRVPADPIPETISCGIAGLRGPNWERISIDERATVATTDRGPSPATAAGRIYVGCGPPSSYTGDLSKIAFPVLSIVGEFDAPNYVTHRLARELMDFQKVVLPGRDHMTSMRSPQYAEALSAFIVAHDPE